MAVQYNSYTTHYKEAECLRQMVEPFLYNYGVDIVFHGEDSGLRCLLPSIKTSSCCRCGNLPLNSCSGCCLPLLAMKPSLKPCRSFMTDPRKLQDAAAPHLHVQDSRPPGHAQSDTRLGLTSGCMQAMCTHMSATTRPSTTRCRAALLAGSPWVSQPLLKVKSVRCCQCSQHILEESP